MIRRPSRSTRTDTLFPYMTRFRSEGVADVAGLVIDEGAALGFDSDGVGRLYPGEQDGFAWRVRPTQAPGRLERGQPLEVDGVRVTGIGADSRLRLPGLEVQAPAFEKIARATGGELALRDADPSAPAASR